MFGVRHLDQVPQCDNSRIVGKPEATDYFRIARHSGGMSAAHMEMASISTGNSWTRFKGSSASGSATEEVLSR
jgi:hypothetical protein